LKNVRVERGRILWFLNSYKNVLLITNNRHTDLSKIKYMLRTCAVNGQLRCKWWFYGFNNLFHYYNNNFSLIYRFDIKATNI